MKAKERAFYLKDEDGISTAITDLRMDGFESDSETLCELARRFGYDRSKISGNWGYVYSAAQPQPELV